jgi:hypothetical protein
VKAFVRRHSRRRLRRLPAQRRLHLLRPPHSRSSSLPYPPDQQAETSTGKLPPVGVFLCRRSLVSNRSLYRNVTVLLLAQSSLRRVVFVEETKDALSKLRWRYIQRVVLCRIFRLCSQQCQEKGLERRFWRGHLRQHSRTQEDHGDARHCISCGRYPP